MQYWTIDKRQTDTVAQSMSLICCSRRLHFPRVNWKDYSTWGGNCFAWFRFMTVLMYIVFSSFSNFLNIFFKRKDLYIFFFNKLHDIIINLTPPYSSSELLMWNLSYWICVIVTLVHYNIIIIFTAFLFKCNYQMYFNFLYLLE